MRWEKTRRKKKQFKRALYIYVVSIARKIRWSKICRIHCCNNNVNKITILNKTQDFFLEYIKISKDIIIWIEKRKARRPLARGFKGEGTKNQDSVGCWPFDFGTVFFFTFFSGEVHDHDAHLLHWPSFSDKTTDNIIYVVLSRHHKETHWWSNWILEM